MRSNILISFCLVLFAFSSLSAQKLMIQDGDVMYEEQKMESINVWVEPSPKEVKNAFKDFVKDRYDIKLKGIGFLSNKDVLSAEEVRFDEITTKEMDFYTKVTPEKNGSKMQVFARLGYDIGINEENYWREYRAMKGVVLDFLEQYLPTYYKDEVESTAEMVSDLTKEREDLAEDIADNKDEIEELKKENEELMKELTDTKKELEKASQTLEVKKDDLKEVSKELKKKNK